MAQRIRSLLIIIAVIVLDRWSKSYIRTEFGPFDSIPIIPGFFNIVHSENPGAAFGVLADASGQWRALLLIGISAVVMVVVAWILFGPSPGAKSRSAEASLAETALGRAGLALVLGGAIGNMWDRVIVGTVTDFLQVFIPSPWGLYEFPSFNVADSAITIGAGLLILDMWLHRRADRNPTHAPRLDPTPPEASHE